MTGLSVLVVDDEPLARRRAIRLLKQLVNGAPIEEAGNVEEARAIQTPKTLTCFYWTFRCRAARVSTFSKPSPTHPRP